MQFQGVYNSLKTPRQSLLRVKIIEYIVKARGASLGETGTMKAAYIEKTGSVDQITYGDLPKPKPTGAQALVQVKAVSVNPIDTYIRSGTVAMELPKPFILGCDLAGVVDAVGPEVKRLKVGDRVWGSNQGLLGRQGTFAQFAAVEEQWLYPIPEEVSFEDAAAIALVGITAHLGLFRDAQLKMGEKVFVHGGSGGVGSCVVQMARAVGARVMTTAGNDDKVQICRKLGANVVVNYRTGNVEEALNRFGEVDVWWESLREPNFERAISHLAHRGRIIVMAGRDAKPALPDRTVLHPRRPDVWICHVQLSRRGAAQGGRRDQSLAGPRQACARRSIAS